ncbi:unnamed protein product [Paramecium sonneborni]|uniref:Transmembrane protein n=1 Tax=Paramecium sonneborni TaxID=65129 RepID=A0A8S1RNQ2_9CILI|nr:unnamed protein product [Paramecium sonneborni]
MINFILFYFDKWEKFQFLSITVVFIDTTAVVGEIASIIRFCIISKGQYVFGTSEDIQKQFQIGQFGRMQEIFFQFFFCQTHIQLKNFQQQHLTQKLKILQNYKRFNFQFCGNKFWFNFLIYSFVDFLLFANGISINHNKYLINLKYFVLSQSALFWYFCTSMKHQMDLILIRNH